jgi:tetratricopeptide (TPR) repeat protein
LRALIAQAVLDRNTNEVTARESWEQIVALARTVGDQRWEARAKAEIGQILYMDGNVEAATALFRDALLSQYVRLDWGAAIYYTAMVGNGLVEAGRPETGLQYCNLVLRLATISGDRGFPFLAYQGKARALFALNRVSEAQETLNEALAHAQEEQNNFALSQLLVVAGTAEASREPAKSIEYLKEAIEVSRENGFEHVYAWSTWGLAKVYRDAGDLDEAKSLASKAIAAMRLLEDRYHLPQHLTLLAGIEAKKGNSDVADELYTEATDLIDALLVNVRPNSKVH